MNFQKRCAKLGLTAAVRIARNASWALMGSYPPKRGGIGRICLETPNRIRASSRTQVGNRA